MTEMIDTSELGELAAASATSSPKPLDPIKGYLYLLPGNAKGLIIQNRPDFRITSVLPSTKRDIITNYNKGVHRRELTTPSLMLSHLFLKGPVSPTAYLSGDAVPNCNCESCSRRFKEAKNLADNSVSPESISHHPACGCFYCKLDRVDNHRQFFLFAWDQAVQDKVMAQPYRPSNVYPDGRICFRKDNDRKIQMPLTLREANSTFWGTAFDPDFIQTRGAIPHTCLRRQHAFQSHRHLCFKGGGHPHSHSCLESIKTYQEEQRLVSSEILTQDSEITSANKEIHQTQISRFSILSEKTHLTKKQLALKEKISFIEKLSSQEIINNYVDVDSLLAQGASTNESLPIELKSLSLKERLEKITPLLEEITLKLTEKDKLITVLSQKMSTASYSKEQLARKHQNLDRKIQHAKERCHCCVGACTECAQKCFCCSARCKCFENCICNCCKLLCNCACACDLSIAFADFVSSYAPPPVKWENYTYYICGEEFYSSSKTATAAFIGFKRDLGESVPESYYRTTPKFEADHLVVGSAFLNEENGTWTVELDKDCKIEFQFNQLRIVR